MKNLLKFLSIAFLASAVLFTTSCSDDDGPVIDTGGSLNLGDGYYLKADGVDPVSSLALTSELVEDDGFAAQDRSGFVAGYIYVTAGDYNLVNVAAKEIETTIGGTTETITDEGSGCDYNDYVVVSTSEDGPAFNIAESGLYKVTYDASTNEMILYQIGEASLIGSATPNGWGADTPLSGSITADGGSFSATEVLMRAGEYKVRFNCRWNLDRRVDPAAGFDASNGYLMFTNFGGTSASNLETGGANIQLAMEDEGFYTVELDWTAGDGFSLNLTKTGDAPVITFDPADFNWAVIGDATANGWDADRNLTYKDVNGVPTWLGVVTLADAGEFKFRANDGWDVNLGGSVATDGTPSTLDLGGGNIPTPGAGDYYVRISTEDEGATWNASMTETGWGIIGAATPTGWDSDSDMNADGFVDGVTTYSITADMTAGEYKFRANDDWEYNLGGDAAALSLDGGNLSIAADGNYTVTLSFDGETYSVDVQ